MAKKKAKIKELAGLPVVEGRGWGERKAHWANVLTYKHGFGDVEADSLSITLTLMQEVTVGLIEGKTQRDATLEMRASFLSIQRFLRCEAFPTGGMLLRLFCEPEVAERIGVR